MIKQLFTKSEINNIMHGFDGGVCAFRKCKWSLVEQYFPADYSLVNNFCLN